MLAYSGELLGRFGDENAIFTVSRFWRIRENCLRAPAPAVIER
jgi:hypothetical protein